MIKMFENMFFLTVWFNFYSILLMHPVYVSVTNMDVDAQKGSIVMSVRIFTDDLETILHNKYNVDGWIGTSHEHRDCRRLLREYVNERFYVIVNNGEKLSLLTDSITIVEDATWFYMKGTSKKNIRRVEINNRLLTDFFAKQTNLVMIGTGREVKPFKLDRKNYTIDLSF